MEMDGVLFRRPGRRSSSSVDRCTCSLFTATEQNRHSIAPRDATVGCVCVCVCPPVLPQDRRGVSGQFVCQWEE